MGVGIAASDFEAIRLGGGWGGGLEWATRTSVEREELV
jgi:hypothetical protein